MALRTLNKASRFAITYNPSSNAGGGLGYGVIASSLFDNADDAKELRDSVEGLIEQSGNKMPNASKKFKGMRELMVPGGKLMFGAREQAKGGTYDVVFGTVGENIDAPFAAIPKATIEGLQTVVNGTFDFAPLAPLASMAQMGISQVANQGGIKPPNLVTELTAMGIIGDDAMRGHFELGYTADSSRFRVTVENAIGTLNAMGTGTGRVTEKDLAAIPADAISASMGLASPDSLSQIIAKLRKQGLPVDEFLGKFEEITEVNLEKELLPSLGGVGGMYSSDSTGGGGLLSYVALLQFKDRGMFMSAHEKLVKAARSIIRQQGREMAKYIRLRSWDIDGTKAFTLTTPGVPIPLEFSYAATDKFLIAGLTPQAVIGAVRQATGKGDKGILSRGDIRLVDAGKQELLSFSFGDTARLMKTGYGMLSLAGSAISNGVRSPGDKSREPGAIIPAFHDLSKGVKPSVSISYRSGKNLIMESASDRSVLAGLCGAMGGMADWLPLVGLGAAGAVEQRKAGGNGFMSGLPFALPADSRQLAQGVLLFDEAVQGVSLRSILMRGGSAAAAFAGK